MASLAGFVIVIVIAIILLIISSIMCTKAAINIYNSIYSGRKNMIQAHKLLTVSASLSWIMVIIAILILSAATYMSEYTFNDLNILNKDKITFEDLLNIQDSESKLKSNQNLQVIAIGVLSIAVISSVTVGVLSLISSVKLSDIKLSGGKINTASKQAITSVVSSFAASGILFLGIVLYWMMRNERQIQIKKIDDIKEDALEKIEK